MTVPRIEADAAYFIKLGQRGAWEAECLGEGTLRFGYNEASHQDCLDGAWDRVLDFWTNFRGDRGTAQRDLNQIRVFYEAGPEALWITFHGGLLYWCRAQPGVTLDAETGNKLRRTVDGWRSTSLGGKPLRTEGLSGALTRVQGFRGTICAVGQLSYLLNRLNDELPPAVAAAEEAREAYLATIRDLIGLLTWQDFELLVDLVFTSSGWRRLGAVGATQKTVDLELEQPTTGEIAFVQVKSRATTATLLDYIERFEVSEKYQRMFFAWHEGRVEPPAAIDGVTLLDRARLAEMTLDAGLAGWLRDRVS